MIYSYENKKPVIGSSVFVAQSADIIGNVKIGDDSSIWFGVVVRGDSNYIKIGRGANVQDNSVIHVNTNDNGVNIEDNVTVGHGAILHGCTVHSNCLIGMGSIIMDNAEIGEGTIIGANSLVTSGKKIPSGVLCMGSPAKIIRKLTEEEKLSITQNAEHYIKMGRKYLEK